MVWLPGEEDALHHIEVLHEDVSLRLGAQVAHRVADAQLDGTFQGGGRGLGERREMVGIREILKTFLSLVDYHSFVFIEKSYDLQAPLAQLSDGTEFYTKEAKH